MVLELVLVLQEYVRHFTYDNTNDALKSSENFNLAAGKTFKIDGVDVIGGGTLNVDRVVADHIVASGLSTVGVLTATGSIFGNFDGNLNTLVMYIMLQPLVLILRLVII